MARGVRCFTRNGRDWADRFPAIATPLMIERCRLAQRVAKARILAASMT
jgi:ATP-dependent DNA ligase